MATLDEILGGSPPSGGNAPKGSAEWAEQNSGENAPVSSTKTTRAGTPQVQTKPEAKAGDATGGGGYEELYRRLNPYTPPTAEELEKEKKKQKRNEIFAAIGDGVMALSNLYFATQYAPSMYDGKKTMSEATRVRYDKLIKDREEKNTAYFNGLLKAKQADADDAHRERSWQRQLGLDQEARDRHNESIAHRNERDAIADAQYESEQEYKRGRDAEADRRWQETFDEDKRRSDRSHSFQKKQHEDNAAIRREQAKATAARGVRGKQLGFADGSGNQVSIYENVWKGSMQQVFDVMVAEGIERGNLSDNRWKSKTTKMTPSQKEDYVKQNWHKSPKASQIMLTLSSIDPATMTSELSDDGGGLGWGNSENNNETDW